ncbi:hypothetical protein DFH09DRAFT_1320493 [Mycena vulgaris]|nr:hypothetical protein DFH09DRAFT_1320493 [Mycena vulgaris]
MDIKMQDHQGIKTKGYIPYGTFTGLKKSDWRIVEHLMLSRWDFVLGNSTIAPAVQAERDLFQAYLDRCNYVVSVMLGALFDVLEIPAGKRFDRGHDASKPCDIRFSYEYGLQVLAPETHQWEFVEPRDRHAVINVGDGLRFVSDKKLMCSPCYSRSRRLRLATPLLAFKFSPLNSALHIFQVNPPTKPPQRNSVGLPPHPSTAMTDADPICVQLLITLSIVLKIAALPRIFHGKYYLQSSLLTFIAWVPSKAATTKIPDDQETISTVRNHNITVGWIFALHVACSGIPDLIEGLRCCIPPEPHSPPGFDQGVIAPFDD